jgi:hypothetical protein
VGNPVKYADASGLGKVFCVRASFASDYSMCNSWGCDGVPIVGFYYIFNSPYIAFTIFDCDYFKQKVKDPIVFLSVATFSLVACLGNRDATVDGLSNLRDFHCLINHDRYPRWHCLRHPELVVGSLSSGRALKDNGGRWGCAESVI